MSTHVSLLSVALGITALLNWGAVVRDDHVVQRITKPTFMLLLGGLAWSLYTDQPPADAPLVSPLLAGLGLSLVGDVLLLTATELRFRFGLLAFLGAHVAYVWTLATVPGRGGFPWPALPALLVVLYLYGRFGRHVVRRAGRDRYAVFVYVLALATLVVLAAVKGDWVVLAGCLLFLVSDTILGHDRFVHERRWAPLAVITTYHAAQVLIVVGLLR
ncbi:MAG: lysoplasmalogenase [Intrasporangium sp.]|uniref:lysoplasmalogenase n=1 Tax=Intrasporangium sp. TaxID=1925024 RepID=UPI002647AA8F|nr:lysoplasmalogenase [Intrasporangium sp.]MDN5794977.1 lysoplasmalogenase [Intrasporangium sp.]